MYNYNSWHKVLAVIVVILWAVFHFQERSDDQLRYEDGSVKRTGETKNNLNQGLWNWYHPNGKIGIEGSFDEGKRIGTWRYYDTTGRLYLESNYENNLLNGMFIQYDTSGQVIRKELYSNDKMIKKLQ